jgi:hypothetical protein
LAADLRRRTLACHDPTDRVRSMSMPSLSCSGAWLVPFQMRRVCFWTARPSATDGPLSSHPQRRASMDDAKPARIGAPRWSTWPPIVDVVAVHRRVARAVGCAFYD